MFGIPNIKTTIYILVVVSFLAVLGLTMHFHDKWVDAEKTISELNIQVKSLSLAIDESNKAIEDLKKQSDAKAEEVKKAQEQAALLAKKNRQLSNDILTWKPAGTDECKATMQLHRDYKAKTEGSGK